jgi:2-polyprenyl-3-methyl-5-hydroxy-6-metoxy-1,4-benzoquinol methylase
MNDALEHNTRENIERLFSDSAYLENYLSDEQLKFYANVVKLAHDKGVEYDDNFIADMGCSTGHLLMHIDDNYSPFGLVGYDFCEPALEVGRKTSHTIFFFNHDLYEPMNKNYEVIFCIQTLEHFEFPEIVLDNILSMMVVGSKAVITIPDGDVDGFFGKFHVRKWNMNEWKIFVEKIFGQHDSDFSIEISRSKAFGPLFTIIERVK